MNKDCSAKSLLKIIDKALDKQSISARQASILATGTPELIRNIRRGSIPSVEKFRSLCDVLKLEFYVGPMRSESSIPRRPLYNRETVYNVLQEILSRLPPKGSTRKIAEPIALREASKSSKIHYIPILEMKAVTDTSRANKDNRKQCYVAFQNDWFGKYNLTPEHCTVLEVCDESMEPTIPNHSMVLVDCSRHHRRAGSIYAIRVGGKPVIKRLSKNKDKWQLTNDHPKWKSEPFPVSAEIIGEVRWMAKTFA